MMMMPTINQLDYMIRAPPVGQASRICAGRGGNCHGPHTQDV